jgi:predicted membrane chloride channel (bestrophin family)
MYVNRQHEGSGTADPVIPVGVSTLLLTVLGFVVGLALSFRSSTAYERFVLRASTYINSNCDRYSDGRKAWATVTVQSRNLARYIWVHVDERSGHEKEDLLAKMSVILS